jgi:hypothetical protein
MEEVRENLKSFTSLASLFAWDERDLRYSYSGLGTRKEEE